ncbi:MAG: type II toxin-antitoxin system PemK/MazF family toxin [Chloroflexota bacterium]|nr:type II toxin-antitoxin system PemK/MazF family toxin [Chloroflexota bacterium]
MARFVKGDIVLVHFPFSDLSGTKLRPALVVATLPGPDVMLRMITSRPTADPDAISIIPADVHPGYIRQSGSIRPSRLFTAAPTLIQHRVGQLTTTKMTNVTNAVIGILSRP